MTVYGQWQTLEPGTVVVIGRHRLMKLEDQGIEGVTSSWGCALDGPHKGLLLHLAFLCDLYAEYTNQFSVEQ